ncbi:tetratricopeptide repeat protein [Flavobacterium sp. SM15]|uniref:tetratricopeptide repeat protein n=1 Tax=Flavobacterium sp. SM15 TaxID=2908005 RepID=UPI001EDAA31F|nr:tetratricopeptide repeat protein [Flavobacterium sp. SM15]MCG2610394.1 tetratricopeptide repeat protein [Flavobacterium sp. SM15]
MEKTINEVKNNQHNSKAILNLERLILSSKDEKNKAKACSVLGETYNTLEVYDKAYDYFIKALNLAKKNKLFHEIGLITEDLGNIQFRLGNYKESIRFYTESKAAFQKIKEANGVIRAKGNMALVALKTGQKQRAIASLTEIIQDKQSDSVIKATSLLSLGNIYLESSNTQLAIEYYLKTLSLIEFGKKDKLKILVYQNLAESYIGLKRYDRALFYNQKSEMLLKKNSSNEFKASLYLLYSQINKGKSQFKEAYENLQLHQNFKERADNSQQAIQIENIEVRNKLQSQKLDLQLKEQKIILLQNEKIVARIKIASLILLVIAFLFLLFYLIKRQRKKVKKLSQTILQTEDRLEFSQTKTDKMVLNILKNNDFIVRFGNNLKQIKAKISDSETKNELTKLIFELQNFKLINDTKDDLFNQVDAQFTYKLEKKYPELKEVERKICVLIYLNLKNKDMAAILNLSVRSIENDRYRIRKKLKLDSNDNLYEVLHNL